MPTYSIQVLEYADVPNYPLSGIVYGRHNQGTRKLPYCYVVIRGSDRVILVDVGYNEKEKGADFARQFGVENWRSPSEVLGEIGLKPEDVTDIIITHGHFDHMGNTDAFPKARFYVQERELTKLVWSMSLDPKFQWMMTGVDPADIMRLADLAFQGRLVCLDGDTDNVMPGIDCRLAADSHTWGSQWVRVRNDGLAESDDSWVLAGDLAYSFENIVGPDPENNPHYIPVGLAMASQYNLLLATDAMVAAAGGDPHRVIPIHEVKLPEAFPSRVNRFGQHIIDIATAP